MDRLVKSEVKELNLVFTRGQKCSTTFELTNLMHTMAVAVSLTTTSPSLLSFPHPFFVVPPLATATATLVSQPSNHPPLSASPPTIFIRTSMLPGGNSSPENLRCIFSKPGRHIFTDARIPINFVGPDVVDFLISSPVSKTIDTMSVFSRAVSCCDQEELNSLLRSAAAIGNSYFVSCLVKAGGDVNHRNVNSESVMSLGVQSGNCDVVRVMIEHGFVIDHLVDRFLHDGALMNGVEIMEVLCMSYLDIDMNMVDSRGRTALHVAANHGYIEVLEFLTTLGGDPDVVDNDGWTPLHYASSEGHVEAVEFLLSSSTYVKYAVTKDGKTAFALAVENDHVDLYDMLHLGDVLHRAATKDDVHGLKKCLADGANVNGKDQNGWTPLHRAAFKGRVEIVKLLLDHGAQVDLVDNVGCTALHRAVDTGHAHVAVLLVARGARASMKYLIDPMVFGFESFKNQGEVRVDIGGCMCTHCEVLT